MGEVSSTDHPVLIVGLVRELQCKNGVALPFERRVIEMPLAAGAENDPRPHVSQWRAWRRLSAFGWSHAAEIGCSSWWAARLAIAIFLYVATANLIRTAVARRNADAARMRNAARPAVGPLPRRL